MSVQRIASRYAKSLIDLAIEQDKLEEVKGDIIAFNKATDNRDLYLLLKSPIINPSKKQEVLKALFDGKFSKMVMSFIQIIVNKNREKFLPEIADEFITQYKAHKHISTVKLISAVPLSDESVAKIKERLVASKTTDDQIEIETSVNPELIGGYVLEFGDRLYDASVAHQLDRIRKEFTKNDHIKNF